MHECLHSSMTLNISMPVKILLMTKYMSEICNIKSITGTSPEVHNLNIRPGLEAHGINYQDVLKMI